MHLSCLNSFSLMQKKQLRLIAKTSDRVGCDFSERVIAKIAVCRQVLGFMLVRWVKHGGW